MRGGGLCCMALLAATACGSDARDAREPGELLSGELTGRSGGEPFPVQYGTLFDWDEGQPFDHGARLSFHNGPVTCDGSYVDGKYPTFAAWIEMEADPQSDEDWDGPYMLFQNSPRVVLEFESGQLHLDRVDEHSASGHLSWGGPGETPDEIYSLEGTFEVERCYETYPGD